MDFRELRIGNWVNGSASGEKFRLTIDMLGHISKGRADVEPIPLTPEILEKAGFIETDAWPNTRYKPQYFFIQPDDRKWKLCVLGYTEGNGIEYLHQLQNLFYCLTGEELNIEL